MCGLNSIKNKGNGFIERYKRDVCNRMVAKKKQKNLKTLVILAGAGSIGLYFAMKNPTISKKIKKIANIKLKAVKDIIGVIIDENSQKTIKSKITKLVKSKFSETGEKLKVKTNKTVKAKIKKVTKKTTFKKD